MSGVQTVTVKPGEAGLRLDRWLKQRYPGIGHGRVQKWLRTGQVRVDGRRVKAGARLEAGQQVRIPPIAVQPPAAEGPARPQPKVSKADAKDLRARILHKDDHVIVIDKPTGLAVQGGSGIGRNLDAMLDSLRFDGDKPRLVHRLDKDTSGVLVLARTAAAARMLTAAFRTKDAVKAYWAVVVGVPRPPSGTIDLALAKTPGRHGERVTAGVADGKRATTRYRVIDRAGKEAAWVLFEPVTGRTHQIRVHAAALGTPVVGDGKYGGRDAFLKAAEIAGRLHLHARAIRMPHPAGGELRAEAPLPPHMVATFRKLGFAENDAEAAIRP